MKFGGVVDLPFRAFCCCAFLVAGSASAAYVQVFGGPEYNSTISTGFQTPNQTESLGPSVNDNGVAIGTATKYASGTNKGLRSVRWNASGAPAAELDNLGTSAAGVTTSEVYSLGGNGTAVGYAQKYVSGADRGSRPIRWEGAGISPTELNTLGTDASGFTNSEAFAVNDIGTAVGWSRKYVSGSNLGSRPVRWDSQSIAATELDSLGISGSGTTAGAAYAVNNSGAAVGYTRKYTSGAYYGERAVRWDGSSSAAIELGNLGTDSGYTLSKAIDVNNAGTTVGYAYVYYGPAPDFGYRAVRWNAGSTVATQLGLLPGGGTGHSDAVYYSYAYDINNAGTTVGWVTKYDAALDIGNRAVRWDANTTTAIELGNLGTDNFESTESEAFSVNESGIAVGFANKYTSQHTLVGSRAVAWKTDNIPIDLNTLIDPASGWTLTRAQGISNTGWITGIGKFDPDGPGGRAAYDRLFLLQLLPIPEPSSALLALLATGGCSSCVARRRSVHAAVQSRLN